MTDDVFVRAFVALAINDDVRRQLAEVQTALRATHAHVGWVPAENIHVSLAFMGDVTQQQVVDLSGAVSETAARCKPFAFEVEHVGVFGSPRSPRIIWAGIRDCPPMMALQSDLAERIQALGVAFDARPFRPHLTLGRVRSPRGRADLVAALETVAARSFGSVPVSDMLLMRSILSSSRPNYSVLHRGVLQP